MERRGEQMRKKLIGNYFTWPNLPKTTHRSKENMSSYLSELVAKVSFHVDPRGISKKSKMVFEVYYDNHPD